MYYSIWAILVGRCVYKMPALGESVARCYSVVANTRRCRSQIPVSGRTTLRQVTVIKSVFTAYKPGRSQFAPAGSPLILPDICARISERIFFAPTVVRTCRESCGTAAPVRKRPPFLLRVSSRGVAL